MLIFIPFKGLWELYHSDTRKSVKEHYVHAVMGTGENQQLIFMGFKGLLELLVELSTRFIQADTTFKRMAG